MTFEGGRAVDVQARTGAEAVRAQLDSDEGARSLGEVSLVEGSSRVRAAGVTFHDTLYDENVGCHVAWGQGFTFCLPDGRRCRRSELAGARAELLGRPHRRRHRRAGRRRRRHPGRRHGRAADPRGRLGASPTAPDDVSSRRSRWTTRALPGCCRAGRLGSPRTPSAPRPWCSSRTDPSTRPARGSGGRRGRALPGSVSGSPVW